jgi:hypothetical protein
MKAGTLCPYITQNGGGMDDFNLEIVHEFVHDFGSFLFEKCCVGH